MIAWDGFGRYMGSKKTMIAWDSFGNNRGSKKTMLAWDGCSHNRWKVLENMYIFKYILLNNYPNKSWGSRSSGFCSLLVVLGVWTFSKNCTFFRHLTEVEA